ncbi:hypothetical protein LTR62_006804 [Meristemomyces frigidus]|uniref:PIN domain-containing protein n=1 Tax=Meristemomyces frigidus TaxID=1508187 RepID=A0AAN7TBS8_9PEZI|nr:hypothetical protein LTR62_006804 [Meristemomyces frigidus]
MRDGARSRPVSQHGPQLPHAPANRKIFNCIVDDTALVAGVKRSTRNGIRQWVKNGQIRLFVPLYALEQLSQQKSFANKHGEDVRETLEWLDDATSKYPHAVTLQGGDQYYANWAEVERFSVPRTLFSELDMEVAAGHNVEARLDGLPDAAAQQPNITERRHKSSISSVNSERSGGASSTRSVRSSGSPVSPPTSPAKVESSPTKPIATLPSTVNTTSNPSSGVPTNVQSLFNYILWRVHQELDPVAALETFIFLCNDAQKVHFAKGFDIRSKRLEQLREAISREDRDVRNRLSMQSRETQQSSPRMSPAMIYAKPNDDEVVYRPSPRAPTAMPQQAQQATNIIDPNAFGRRTDIAPAAHATPLKPAHVNELPSIPRGGMQPNFTPRGNNSRGSFRGSRGRGNFGRRGNIPNQAQSSGQIDPDSFERPNSAGPTRGMSRKLWVPT